ncbi:MAG: hypothetical protein GEU71_19090 [Actinobacteria bacterium]|nr:hypothetical protein [Actinomycetota bacterium]
MTTVTMTAVILPILDIVTLPQARFGAASAIVARFPPERARSADTHRRPHQRDRRPNLSVF